MVFDAHIAYLFASLSVLFGLTYSISQYLNFKIAQAKSNAKVSAEEVLIS